jgi:hypothetical protein
VQMQCLEENLLSSSQLFAIEVEMVTKIW